MTYKTGVAMPLEFREVRLPELWQASRPSEPVPAEFAEGHIRSWECLHDAQVVGHCSGNAATGEVLGLSVVPAYRRQGIARRLLAVVVAWLRSQGTERIWLSAPSDPSRPAHAFYRAQGWVPTGVRENDAVEILELLAPPPLQATPAAPD